MTSEDTSRRVLEALVLDPDVPSPRGSGADRYQRLAEPLGPPAASHDVLCAECARVSYGDPARHRAAMTDDTRARLWESYERADASWDRLAAEGVEDDESRWPSGPQCERCGSAV